MRKSPGMQWHEHSSSARKAEPLRGCDIVSPFYGFCSSKRCPAGYWYSSELLELFDTGQDFPTEQLDFFHHFPVVGAGLLEAHVHHAHAALVMERLQLLHDGVGAPHQGQQPPPGLDRLPGSLGAAGSDVAVARVELLAVARREHRPGH